MLNSNYNYESKNGPSEELFSISFFHLVEFELSK